MKNFLNQRGRLYIGNKPVEIKKITIAQWKQLFGTIETLPALIVDVLTASEEDRTAYFIVALERSFDEITSIVSLLTEIDAEYIEKNASLDEVVEYFVKMAEVNDFNKLAKNVKSVLALAIPKKERDEGAQKSK